MLLTACAGMSSEDNARLRREVAATVTAGGSLESTTARLADIGFECDSRPSATVVSCTRQPNNVFLYGCVHRVNLTPDAGRRTVAAIEVAHIACAGL